MRQPLQMQQARQIPLRLLLLVAALPSISLASCSDGGGPSGPPPCFLDEARFRDLSASPGATPVFDWCGSPAKSLAVENLASRGTVWRVECTGAVPLCIDPPVTYGDSLANTNATPAPPLQPGVQYQFCLFGIGDRPPSVCLPFSP